MSKIKLTSALLVSATIFFNSVMVGATPVKDDNYKMALTQSNFKTNISEGIAKSQLNNFKNDPKSVEALKELEKNAVSYNSSQAYIRVIQDGCGNVKVDPKKYTEEEYELLEGQDKLLKLYDNKKITRSFPNKSENSWIRINLDGYEKSNGEYEFYLFYDWKKRPLCYFSDVLALGHDSNIYFNNSTARSHHESISIDLFEQEKAYVKDYKSSQSSHCKTSVNGIAFKFKIDKVSDVNKSMHRGYMTVKGRFTNSTTKAGNMEISYAHTQLAFDYNIQDAIEFLTSGNIKLKVKGYQDVISYSDVFYRRRR